MRVFSMFVRNMRGGAAWMAVVALVFQPQLLLAKPLPGVGEPVIHVVDVALGTNGSLRGQLLDRQGQQLPVSKIQITNGHQTWNTYTSEEGYFRLEGLVGSTYQLQAAGQVHIVRAWAEGTAPPHALKALLIVHDNRVVLGQHCGTPLCGSAISAAKHPLANPFILGGLIAAAIAIPVAIHNSNDDHPACP
jgi:hypothetical protein